MMPRYCILNACTQPIMFKKCLECANYAQIYWNTLNQYPHKYEWIEYSELANAKKCQNNTKFNVHMQLMLTKYKSTLWNVRIMPIMNCIQARVPTKRWIKWSEHLWCSNIVNQLFEQYDANKNNKSNVRKSERANSGQTYRIRNTDKNMNQKLRSWKGWPNITLLNQMFEQYDAQKNMNRMCA